MKTTVLYDYTQLDSNDDIKLLKNIQDNIRPEDFLIIDKDDADFVTDKKVILIRDMYSQYWTQQYVGIISGRTEDHLKQTVIIDSRFSKDQKNHHFLNYLISKVYHIKYQVFTEMDVMSDYDAILEKLLIIAYFHQLNKASKKGLYRTYHTYHENNSHVRGTIDIASHIKLNLLQNNGKISYSHREYTTDNPVNRLVYAAYTYAQKKYPAFVRTLQAYYTNCDDTIQKLSTIFESFSRQQLRSILNDSHKKISHSIYKDWEPVRKTSRLLLRNLGIPLSDDSQSNMKGILLNMNFLWEEYAREITRLNTKNEKILRTYEIRMDMYRTPLVLDAKYKNAWSKIYKDAHDSQKIPWGQVRDDLYQVLSYMLIKECNCGGVLFPTQLTGSEKKSAETALREIYSDNEIFKYCYDLPNNMEFYLIPLLIPGDTTYDKFEKNMNLCEQKIKDLIDKISPPIPNQK